VFSIARSTLFSIARSTLFSIARSTLRMYSVMAIFRSSVVWGLYDYTEFFIAPQRNHQVYRNFCSRCTLQLNSNPPIFVIYLGKKLQRKRQYILKPKQCSIYYKLLRDICGFAAARLLGPLVQIPPGSSMSVFCESCVLSGRGICAGLITRPEESYRV
jgi:hypothetical protein